ncbi:MAG: hypothetical protein MRZ54_10730 [Clostridiales bacterium]|nr:hypothetical protein [Clostridiales bacterium]
MNDKDIRIRLHHAMDARLSGMTGDPRLAQRIISAEGSGRVKRKISVGVVIAIMLFLLTLGALAATLLWESYVSEVMRKEQQAGNYSQWSAGDKAALIEALVEMGYVEKSQETEALLNADTAEVKKSALADQILLSLLEQSPYIQSYTTSFNHDVSSVTSGLLTMAIMGPMENWPAEKRVWWQRLTNPHISSANDIPLVNPQQGDISEAEAISIATKAVLEILNVPQSELETAQAVADLYVTDERPEYRRWFVTFNVFAEGSNEYIERWYEVFIDSAGNLIADPDFSVKLLEAKASSLSGSGEEGSYPPLLEQYNEYAQMEESYLVREWSIETKAAYSADVRAQVLAALESGDLASLTDAGARYPAPHRELIASTACAYGLPQEDDIPLDEARDLARRYVWNAYGLDEQTNREHYSYYEYYDITHPKRPLWKFVFFPESFEGMSAVPVYKVELDAYTGEQTAIESAEWREIFFRPPFDPIWY